MIDHTSISVTDLDKSAAFYQAALAPLGYEVIVRIGDFAVGLGVGGKPDFWLGKGPAGASRHVAFRADKRSMVNAFYQAAIATGGKDNGPPGPRTHYHAHYYGGFVLDPDGHNIEACCHEPYLG